MAFRFAAIAATAGLALMPARASLAQTPAATPPCRIAGRVTSAGTPLPGVVLRAVGTASSPVTSTDADGRYVLRVEPAGSYRLEAELAIFTPANRAVTVPAAPSCDRTIDLELLLASRAAPSTAPAASAAQGTRPAGSSPAPGSRPAPGSAVNRGGTVAGSRQRFEPLAVVGDASVVEGLQGGAIDASDPAATLLPPGFSPDAPSEALAVTGGEARLDRGMLNDRMEAIGRGEFQPGAGPPPNFAFGGGPFGPGGPGGGDVARGGPGGPGGPPFGGPGGGPPGGGFAFGPGFRNQNRYQGNLSYTLGGSALDAMPYPLRPDSRTDPSYLHQQFSGTVGGPVRLPGITKGTRTSFFVNYGGSRTANLQDLFATVPTDRLRAGDFSGSALPLIDPATGLPFAGNQIPATRIDPAARALLTYLPLPNLPGTAQNYHAQQTARTTSDNLSVRLTQRFTDAPTGGRGPGGRGPFGGRGFGGGDGRGRGDGPPQGPQRLSVILNAQVQFQRSHADTLNPFPALDGRTTSSSLAVPVSLNIMRGRTMHTVSVTLNRTRASSTGPYAGLTNVTGAAGIAGAATDPFDWGVPSLSFTGFTGLQDVTPSSRTDTRLQAAYTWMHPGRTHTWRLGGDVRTDHSASRTDANARGAFIFTGLYTGGGTAIRGGGADFADFLLGLPQQASVQFGPGTVQLRGRALSAFAQDDWRYNGKLTFNLGVRYELVQPYTEADGRLVNLDVNQGFTAVAPVVSGGTGPFSGAFPAGLLHADTNNLAPRVGIAWRATPKTIVRAGYGISFNNGAYAAIARQLVAQPPFAVTNTTIGTTLAPLALSSALNTASADISNTFGVDSHYRLGVIQTWNVDVNRTLPKGWVAGGGYTGTRGSHLDLLRAPNRGPDGLRIAGVQPFIWESSDGTSILHAATVRVRRRPSAGYGLGATYTLARSVDDASSVGGGQSVVAQNDLNLAAERGLSSFDRRHQFSADGMVELPFGEHKPWLNRGGTLARMLSGWTITATLTAQSGTPFTARVLGAVADVARGTNGTLRADVTGQPIAVDSRTLLAYFNTAAFALPSAGAFGNAGRNTIIGPGFRQLNAALSRDLTLSRTRVLTVRAEATNVLNSVEFQSIDTVVNSPTFGQVTSVRPMRTIRVVGRLRF